MKRDPRVDPRSGDVLRKGRTTRTVIGMTRHSRRVMCKEETGSVTFAVWPTLTQFRKWAASAEVLNAAE